MQVEANTHLKRSASSPSESCARAEALAGIANSEMNSFCALHIGGTQQL